MYDFFNHRLTFVPATTETFILVPPIFSISYSEPWQTTKKVQTGNRAQFFAFDHPLRHHSDDEKCGRSLLLVAVVQLGDSRLMEMSAVLPAEIQTESDSFIFTTVHLLVNPVFSFQTINHVKSQVMDVPKSATAIFRNLICQTCSSLSKAITLAVYKPIFTVTCWFGRISSFRAPTRLPRRGERAKTSLRLPRGTRKPTRDHAGLHQTWRGGGFVGCRLDTVAFDHETRFDCLRTRTGRGNQVILFNIELKPHLSTVHELGLQNLPLVEYQDMMLRRSVLPEHYRPRIFGTGELIDVQQLEYPSFFVGTTGQLEQLNQNPLTRSPWSRFPENHDTVVLEIVEAAQEAGFDKLSADQLSAMLREFSRYSARVILMEEGEPGTWGLVKIGFADNQWDNMFFKTTVNFDMQSHQDSVSKMYEDFANKHQLLKDNVVARWSNVVEIDGEFSTGECSLHLSEFCLYASFLSGFTYFVFLK